MKRTSDEKIISIRVNVSEQRARHPNTTRCLQPELNPEPEPENHKKKQLTGEQRLLKHGNQNLIAGESTSAIDHRVRNKNNWKIGLINKYENNQDMWGNLTNDMVNKWKEEARYVPERDFVREEDQWVDDRLARKLEIMQDQCRMHKENMQNNPITGNRCDTPPANPKRKSGLSELSNRSNIRLEDKVERSEIEPPKSGKRQFVNNPMSKSQVFPVSTGQDKPAKQPRTPSQRSTTPGRSKHRDQYMKDYSKADR